MTEEQIEQCIEELVNEIKSKNFEGTDEEIKIQQIMYFDKYVKDNIDYGFEAVNFQMQHPNEPNPYESAFKREGFFMTNEETKKRLAVCGSISLIANYVLTKLGIKCEYVWGHFNIGTEENPVYLGHRWNKVTIGEKSSMLDFTMEMIIHNIGKNETYYNAAQQLLGTEPIEEYDFLFFDTLPQKETIGGFKKNEHGETIDDIDEQGHLRNASNGAKNIIPNLVRLDKNFLLKYKEQIKQNRTY